MPQFSLSPAVTVNEINLTSYVPNIPSARTGAVLRADTGPCLEVTNITNENDLVTYFGQPDSNNYQDWFQCWNFVQYASSLYVVRPMNVNTENAAIGMTGSNGSTVTSFGNMYNNKVALYTLEPQNFTGVSDTLYFINKNVTSKQKYAVGVCSSPQNFKSPIAMQYFAVVQEANGTPSVTATGTSSLAIGSQIITNSSTLATVQTISRPTIGETIITFDTPISASDVAAFYGVSISAETAVGNGNYSSTFQAENFTLQVGTVIGTSEVISIGNIDQDTLLVTTLASAGIIANHVYSSSTVNYKGSTSFNNTTGDFGVAAGATSIALQSGFILQPGVEFILSANGASASSEPLQVSTVDNINNIITLVVPTVSSVSSTGSINLTIVTSQTVPNFVVGINYFDRVFDSSMIIKTNKTVILPSNGNVTTVAAQSLVSFNRLFNYAPVWANQEMALVILQLNTNGYWQKFKTYTVSYDPTDTDNTGASLFIETVLNNDGTCPLYAKVGNPTGTPVDTAQTALGFFSNISGTVYPVQLGTTTVYNGAGYTQGDIDNAYSLFADPESFDVNILLNHQLDENYASTISETRKDCVAIVSPYNYAFLSQNSNNDCTAWLLNYYGTQTNFSSKNFSSFGTYSAIYGNMKYQYDKWNNVNRWVAIGGDVAGLYAQTDSTTEPWFAPAGATRGVIKNAIKLAFNPNKQNRDDLYINGINPVMAIAGEGNAVVWGQKTATDIPSAFDRVNVRRLLIYLEKSIATAVAFGLFEFNDTFTRSRLFNVIDPFLRQVQNGRGLYTYKVIVDATNNTAEVIDENGLVIDIYLQPTKVAEFINLNCIVTPTGANFNEYVGSF